VKAWALRLQTSWEDLRPEQVALLLSVGLVLGVFPIVGCPTLLCLLVAIRLRLNVVALQLINNASSPLQIALLLPLTQAGASLCGNAFSTNDSWVRKAGSAALHATVGWACICIPLGALMYIVLLTVMRRARPVGGLVPWAETTS
jgi:uncharacterized protein (DUF2062 family)